MAVIDYQRGDESRIGPRADSLGLGCFVFHVFIAAYIIFGWIVSPTPALVIYLVLLPAVVAQWYVNRGSCVINNLESWMRSGRWRDAQNRDKAGSCSCCATGFSGCGPTPSFWTGSAT
jgi:hypothetical protein